MQEFNHGLVFSAGPLQDNQMVEVRIDKKIHSWSGSIEMGITQCDPNMLEAPFPSSATELREGTWIMSGNSILRDGRSINENYGTDLGKPVFIRRNCFKQLLLWMNDEFCSR